MDGYGQAPRGSRWSLRRTAGSVLAVIGTMAAVAVIFVIVSALAPAPANNVGQPIFSNFTHGLNQ